MDKLFYANGTLYAQLSEERREYYYENGQPKTTEPLLNGQLHGQVELFWPNGQLKRRCVFVNGVRKGLDQMWDETGKLVDEDLYE